MFVISVFKPVYLLTSVTCIRLNLNTSLQSVHSVKVGVCLLRDQSPKSKNFSSFLFYDKQPAISRYLLQSLWFNCVYLSILPYFGIFSYTCSSFLLYVYVYCTLMLCVIMHLKLRGLRLHANNEVRDETRENYGGPEPPYLFCGIDNGGL